MVNNHYKKYLLMMNDLVYDDEFLLIISKLYFIRIQKNIFYHVHKHLSVVVDLMMKMMLYFVLNHLLLLLDNDVDHYHEYMLLKVIVHHLYGKKRILIELLFKLTCFRFYWLRRYFL